MPRLASPEQALRQESESPIDRKRLVAQYRRNRERSRLLFDLLTDEEAHYSQPIPLRHPFVFYEGHVPAFSFNLLVKTALGAAGIDPALERLFARGIDPPTDQATAPEAASNRERWPDLRSELAAIFRTRTRDEWAWLLQDSDCCVAPVLSLSEAPRSAHAVARNAFRDVGGVIQPAPAPRFSRTAAELGRPPAHPGEHTNEALRDWGFSADDIGRLRSVKAIV